jgi:hypothetical protein
MSPSNERRIQILEECGVFIRRREKLPTCKKRTRWEKRMLTLIVLFPLFYIL